MGSGLRGRLVSQAMRKAEELGAPSVSLFTSKKNYAALGLYRKLGFQVMPVPSGVVMEQYLESLSRTGGRRIVLSKSLPHDQSSFISADIQGRGQE
jgi:citrate lyase synthetase